MQWHQGVDLCVIITTLYHLLSRASGQEPAVGISDSDAGHIEAPVGKRRFMIAFY